ncbi:MAG: hypothetical protein ACTSSH_10610, partial [Candidatus Heimdallarchaeota archaeon]
MIYYLRGFFLILVLVVPVEIDQNLCGKCLGCAIICPESLY